jgi:hypothetical protein
MNLFVRGRLRGLRYNTRPSWRPPTPSYHNGVKDVPVADKLASLAIELGSRIKKCKEEPKNIQQRVFASGHILPNEESCSIEKVGIDGWVDDFMGHLNCTKVL